MGEGDESREGKGRMSVGGGRAGRDALGFVVVVPFLFRGDGDCSGAGVCRECVLVLWCRVVGGSVCRNHGLSHGVEEGFPSTRSEVIGEGE